MLETALVPLSACESSFQQRLSSPDPEAVPGADACPRDAKILSRPAPIAWSVLGSRRHGAFQQCGPRARLATSPAMSDRPQAPLRLKLVPNRTIHVPAKYFCSG